MHLKRQAVPKNWPISKKETKYIVKPGSNYEHGLPVLVLLRDILRVTQNKKEVKRAIFQKNILVNDKPVKDESRSVLLFDTLTIVPAKKAYRLTIGRNGKFRLDETDIKDAKKKIVKISNKKALKGKKIQLNFNDGENLISNIKCNTNDSAVIDFVGKKIEKIIPLNKGSKVFIYSGKHSGQTGEVKDIDKKDKTADVGFGTSTVKVLIKQLIAIE